MSGKAHRPFRQTLCQACYCIILGVYQAGQAVRSLFLVRELSGIQLLLDTLASHTLFREHMGLDARPVGGPMHTDMHSRALVPFLMVEESRTVSTDPYITSFPNILHVMSCNSKRLHRLAPAFASPRVPTCRYQKLIRDVDWPVEL